MLQVQTDLQQKGWAVVPALSQAEVDSFVTKLWAWLEAGFGVERSDPATYKRWPYTIRGLMQHYEVGQQAFCWDLRLHQAVLQAFAEAYGTDDLLVSMDGICFAKPTHSLRRDGRPHTDQPSGLPAGRRSLQGMVCLTPASAEGGTLRFWEGSHALHKGLDLPRSGGLHCLSPEQLQSLAGCQQRVVEAPAGSLVLWDSRTVHQGLVPAQGSQRIAAYICYQPREYATRKDLAKKRKCFEAYRMTTHAAAEGVQAFPKSARHMKPAAVPVETIRDRQTCPAMLRLAGF